MDKDYYTLLEIKKDATSKDIKRAYSLLVRKYPPEKFGEEFSEISKAYEVLMDSNKRREYDELYGFDNVAQELLDSALSNISEDKYDTAVRALKKFIMLEPEVNRAKNYLLNCYYRSNNYELAYKIGKEIIDSNRDLKEVYFTNVYDVCMNLHKFSEAEGYILNGLRTFDTYGMNLKLVKLYTNNNYSNKEKAREILFNKVSPLIAEEEYDLENYINLSYYAGVLNEISFMKKQLSYIVNNSQVSDFEEVSNRIMTYAELWVNLWYFKNSLACVEAVINLGNKMNNGGKAIREYIDACEYVYNVYSQLEILSKDDSINFTIIEYVVNDLRLLTVVDEDDSDDEMDIKKEAERISDEISGILKTNPYDIKSSIDSIKKKYELVYNEVENEVRDFYIIATKKIEEFEARLRANENKSSDSSNSYVYTNTKVNSNSYDNSYSGNSSSNNNSNSYSNNSSNNNNYSSDDNNSSVENNSTSKPSSSKVGCGTGIIYMIIGGYLGGPIGAFIGFILWCFMLG